LNWAIEEEMTVLVAMERMDEDPHLHWNPLRHQDRLNSPVEEETIVVGALERMVAEWASLPMPMPDGMRMMLKIHVGTLEARRDLL
jgi:hypothetical protein